MNAVLAELLVLLPALWWPFCRYAAAISIAPFLGESVVPVRARLGLALALAVATLPAMRGLPPIDPFSLHGVVTAIEQAVIGLLFGLAFQLVMTILSLLGFLVSSQMGLSMAVMNDPGNGSSSDVISNLLYLLAALLFFAMDGHLVLTQVVFDSFKVWPVGSGLLPQSLARLAASLGWVFAAAILLALWHWRQRDNLSGYAAGLGALAAFVAAMMGIVAFVSLYIYEHPHHHCPFCILKPEYDYQGYLLYIPLFAAAAAGLAAGVLRMFGGRPSLATLAPQASARLAGIAAAGFALFVLVASVMVLRSNLILLD